jgi:putative transposase
VHKPIFIPPKSAEAQVIGFIKGKRAIRTARIFGDPAGNFIGERFWARGHDVSTAIGRDENVIRGSVCFS